MHVQKLGADIPGAQVVHRRQGPAPGPQPEQQRLALLGSADEVGQQVHVAAGSCRPVLGPANHVQGADAHSGPIQAGRQTLGHVHPPLPVLRVVQVLPRPPGPNHQAGGTGLTEHPDGQLLFGIAQDSQNLPFGLAGDVDHPQNLRQVGERGQQLTQDVVGSLEEEALPGHIGIVRIERKITDPRLDQVLEEVGSERQVRDVVPGLAGDLDHDGRVVDVGIGDRNAQSDIPSAAPAPRTQQGELAPGEHSVEPSHGPADLSHGSRIQGVIGLRIHVHHVGDLGCPAVGDVSAGREQDLRGGEIRRDHVRIRIRAEALIAALQEVEIGPIMGELQIHGMPQGLLQDLEHEGHSPHEIGLGDQTIEGDDVVAVSEVEFQRRDRTQDVLIHAREQAMHQRPAVATLAQDLVQRSGAEVVGFQIQQVHPARRVAHHLVRGLVDAQLRLARGQQDRIVVGKPVHGPGPQPGDQAQQAILALDPWRPAQFVAAEGHPGKAGHVVAPDPGPHHLLDQDRHLFVEVQQSPFGAVADRIRREDRGVDLGDGPLQRLQAFLARALVGQEQAAILPRERGPGTVLQQA